MKILVVDDSSFIILVCKKTLEKAGHEIVGEAYDGVEALGKAQSLKPDVVIMDVALPKKNGFEAAQLILQDLPNTKILIISAIEEEWVKDKALATGCHEFLAKPFETEHLLKTIESLESSLEELKYG